MTDSSHNRLIASLPSHSRDRLLPFCERVDLPLRATLTDPATATSYAYFPETGLASMVAINHDASERVEVGHIGFEGMTGLHLVLGVNRTLTHTFMQVAGSGLRISAERLAEAMDTDNALRSHLLRYGHVFHLQLAYSTLANARYTIPQRLARWLLMCNDRLQGDTVLLTHEFLSLMLGVRRSGVTNEIHVLEGEHAIRATRASIKILDRAKLIELANGSYGAPEAEYARLIEGKG